MSIEESGGTGEATVGVALGGAEARELLDRCIHCGLCLPSCPTYTVFRREMDGPRGRIALMRGVAEERIDVEGAFTRHIDLCVGCLACETACPSGVEYGSLLDLAHRTAATARRRGTLARSWRWLVFRQLLPHPRRLRVVAKLSHWARLSGLLALARTKISPPALRRLAELAPAARGDTVVEGSFPEADDERRHPRVALFSGCVQEAFLGRVNRATLDLLRAAGYAVDRPSGQTCCGALALHCGDEEAARDLARANLEAFDGGWECVVTNAGGCGAMLVSYPRLFRDDPRLESRARELAARVRDVSEALETAPAPLPSGRFEGVLTYADSCHLRHGQGVAAGPRRLLSALPGSRLVELEHPDRCCGSGAAYNLVEADAADRLLDLKIEEIHASGASVVVSSNPGCHLQLERGLRRAGLEIEVLHLVEVLARAASAAATEAEGVS